MRTVRYAVGLSRYQGGQAKRKAGFKWGQAVGLTIVAVGVGSAVGLVIVNRLWNEDLPELHQPLDEDFSAQLAS